MRKTEVDEKEIFKFVSKKECEPIVEFLKSNFGYKGKFDYSVVISTKNRIYICHRDIEKIDCSYLKISSAGVYFGERLDHGVRLSVEGSQMIGPECTENVIELDDKQADQWLKGYELDAPREGRDFVIIKHGRDYLGCGKLVRGNLVNYLNKARRIRATVE